MGGAYRRFTIPDFDTLDGYDIIGGETLLSTLDGTYVEPPETLDDADFLDGNSAICGETLDGTGTLDGNGDLRYPLLGDGEDFLDGTSNLGEIPAPAIIAFWGRVRVRHGSLTYQEPL